MQTEQQVQPAGAVQPSLPGRQVKRFSWPVALILIFGTMAAVWTTGMTVGNAYFWSGVDIQRLKDQAAYYQQVVMENPNDPQQRVNLGFTYFQLGRDEEALDTYNAALGIDPKFYPAYLNKGYLLVEVGNYDAALEAFQECVKINPTDYRAHLNQGIAFYHLGMYEQALDSISTAQQLNAGGAEIHYYAGKIYEAQNDVQAAIEAYNNALKFDPSYEKAQEALMALGQ